MALKEEGRLKIDPNGRVVVTATPQVADSYPSSARLSTTWTGKVWEPKGSGGSDDLSHSYVDPNYWNLCGPGSAAVTLYYWSDSYSWITGILPAYYQEPYWPTGGYHANTYWKATDSAANGRGAIMYLAEKLLPTPDELTWAHPGLIDWTDTYPNDGTPINREVDGLNWVASGFYALNYWYLRTAPANITSYTQLLTYVEADITSGVPMVVYAETGNGSTHLGPEWYSTSRVPHAVAVVGYDNSTQQYTYVDTCGPGCNDTGKPAGVYTISEQNMYALMRYETYHDGVIW
ncbi:MAG TPA: hypothetical protein VFW92_04195 [Candidatus Limnocylindrales bacterium]|nr:hypothetical protein [Candidatus Limnocylindrales bacterium]